MKKSTFIFLLFIFCFSVSHAEISLSSLFGDNMVLQQQSEVPIWGKAEAGHKVSLVTSWNKKKYTTKADNYGNWKIKISTPVAGGPYDISISDGKKMSIKNVLIGEVWVCSGQSNMEMTLRGNSSPILNANQIILNAENSQIRLFTVSRASSLTPREDPLSKWKEATPETAREFSALAFQYGQILQQKLKVPIGLIVSSVGGTKIQAWMNAESLEPFPEVKIPETLEGSASPHKETTALFNGMIKPIAGYGIKGFLWYQGESNRHEPELYGKLFPAMVAEWRKQWDLGEIPFYYVQIAPFGLKSEIHSGPKLREAQLNAMKIIPNSGMASAIDAGMEKDIHPMDKSILAQRLSYWALAKTYGIKGIGFNGPIYQSMKTEGNKAILTFDNAPYLTSYKKDLTLFEIAGADKVFYPATAKLNKNQVVVQSNKVENPVAVRYAFKEWVVGELYNNDGLPASSFRTDDW